MRATKFCWRVKWQYCLLLSNSSHNITMDSNRRKISVKSIHFLNGWWLLNSFNYTHPKRMKYGIDNIVNSRHVKHYISRLKSKHTSSEKNLLLDHDIRREKNANIFPYKNGINGQPTTEKSHSNTHNSSQMVWNACIRSPFYDTSTNFFLIANTNSCSLFFPCGFVSFVLDFLLQC